MEKPKIRTVLLVDDEFENMQIIADSLGGSNGEYIISRAPNGRIAYEICEKKLPDIVITDWEMPEVNGIELTKMLKRNLATKDIPVIICTGVMTSPENLQTALNAGAMDYIRKPIDQVELLARTHAAIVLADNIKHVKAQNKQLQELNMTKDRILSIIAHDLRGPIGSVRMLLEFFTKEDKAEFNPRSTQLLKMAHNASNHSLDLLDNLLKWSQSQLEIDKKACIDFDLKEAMVRVCEMYKSLLLSKSIDFQVDICSAIICADRNKIETIFRNLLSNAFKFTPQKGKIKVNMEVETDHVLVSISDTGVGIPDERLGKLFNFLDNKSTKGTNGEQGTGLGLVLVNEFVQKSGGTIWVNSRLGEGSTFFVQFPLA